MDNILKKVGMTMLAVALVLSVKAQSEYSNYNDLDTHEKMESDAISKKYGGCSVSKELHVYAEVMIELIVEKQFFKKGKLEYFSETGCLDCDRDDLKTWLHSIYSDGQIDGKWRKDAEKYDPKSADCMALKRQILKWTNMYQTELDVIKRDRKGEEKSDRWDIFVN